MTEQIEQTEAEQSPTRPAPMEWTSRGEKCWATFRDAEELTGADLKALRRAAEGPEGERGNGTMATILTLFVEQWSIGYAPTLAEPRSSRTPGAILEQLTALDVRRLERHVQPYADLLAGDGGASALPEDGFGSPRMPARG